MKKRRENHIALIVSFFTTTFYGDDKTGETLYGINLKELSKKANLLSSIDTAGNSNRFILPEPQDE